MYLDRESVRKPFKLLKRTSERMRSFRNRGKDCAEVRLDNRAFLVVYLDGACHETIFVHERV